MTPATADVSGVAGAGADRKSAVGASGESAVGAAGESAVGAARESAVGAARESAGGSAGGSAVGAARESAGGSAGGSSIGTVWEALVAGALLGTDRRPFTPGDLAAGLPAELAELAVAGGDLAGAAAALWACREAGRLPAPCTGVTDPEVSAAAPDGRPLAPAAAAPDGRPLVPAEAAPDGRPLVPAEAVRSLAAIVSEPTLRPLLGEWLHLAAGSGRRLPPEWLPQLLDLAPDRHRSDLDAAGGPRVAWLAALRPEWSAGGSSARAAALAEQVLAGGEPEWEGSDDDRLGAFTLVRRTDAATARRLAERVWSGEPPASRAALVAVMTDGLGAGDEPFLEAALDDRRKEVRLAAAALLARLPTSRFGARMAARARAAVRLTDAGSRSRGPAQERPGPARGRPGPAQERPGPADGAPPPRLWVDVPAEPDAAARRDGITAGAGQPERWILQVVSACPLDAWPEPDRWAAAVAAAGTVNLAAGAMLTAWSLAAERQGDTGWARRLVAAGAPPTAGTLSLLPAAELESFVPAWLARVGLSVAAPVLAELPGPWSGPVTASVLGALRALVASGETGAAAVPVRDALPRLALAADHRSAGAAAAVAGALEALPDDRRPGARLFWGRSLSSLNALVHFRQAMHQEFSTP